MNIDFNDTLTLDPNDPFEAVVIRMVETNRRKRADYAGDGNVFQNFIDAAYQTGTTPGFACETHIATKQSRLRNLLGSGRAPQNESVADTILDRAVYSTLSLAMYEQGLYTGIPDCSATVEFSIHRSMTMKEVAERTPLVQKWFGEGEKTDG